MREMKDSGAEWLGSIPSDWSVTKTKYAAEIFTGNSISDNEKDNYTDSNDAIPYIATKDIRQNYNTINYENGLYIKKDDHSFVRANQGSTLMCIEGGSAGRKKAYVDREICFVNKLCCFTPKDYYGKYLYYVLNSPNYEAQFNLNISGLIGGVSKSILKEFVLPKPEFEVQKNIADYLDEKCSKIDEIIAKQEQIIEKLKAYKLSVITEAVTKGKREHDKYVDSNFEWIGSIPESWSLKKLKYASNIMRGRFNHRPRNDPRFYDGEYPFVQTGDVARAGKFIAEYSQTLNEFGYEVSKEFPKGSICMTIAANVGDVAILDFDACFPDSVVGFVPEDGIYRDYLFFVFKAMKQQLTRNAIISTQLNLNIEIIKEEFIPVPSIEEQIEIADFLNQKNEMIDKKIKQKKTVIDKLDQYKKSLIYEVVTGKKEV